MSPRSTWWASGAKLLTKLLPEWAMLMYTKHWGPKHHLVSGISKMTCLKLYLSETTHWQKQPNKINSVSIYKFFLLRNMKLPSLLHLSTVVLHYTPGNILFCGVHHDLLSVSHETSYKDVQPHVKWTFKEKKSRSWNFRPSKLRRLGGRGGRKPMLSLPNINICEFCLKSVSSFKLECRGHLMYRGFLMCSSLFSFLSASEVHDELSWITV